MEGRDNNGLDENSMISHFNELYAKSKNFKEISSSNQIVLNSASLNCKQNIVSEEYEDYVEDEKQNCSEFDLEENGMKNKKESQEGMVENIGCIEVLMVENGVK